MTEVIAAADCNKMEMTEITFAHLAGIRDDIRE
jgi:hypothetical protein